MLLLFGGVAAATISHVANDTMLWPPSVTMVVAASALAAPSKMLTEMEKAFKIYIPKIHKSLCISEDASHPSSRQAS